MQTTECLYFWKYLCYLSAEEGMSLAGIYRMITDIQKYKIDNLFSDQSVGSFLCLVMEENVN